MPDFKDILLRIKESGKPYTISVRGLMKSVGHYRRDTNVNHDLRKRLQRSKLTTDPEFELVSIDSKIRILPLDGKKPAPKPQKEAPAKAQENPAGTEPPQLPEEQLEVFRTIGQLTSAVRPPVQIAKEESISRAVTLMLQEGVDHLVVCRSLRNIEGIVTWTTLGKKSVGRQKVTQVADCMERDAYTVPYNSPLFDVVREITRRGIVLVADQTRAVTGSVTSADIAEQFVNLSEPFLFLEQIENHLRSLLRAARLNQEALQGLVDPMDEARKARTKTVSDLTFGETLRAFEKPEIWDKLQINLDRKTVIGGLAKVNEIRNKVMHFHPDGISSDDRELLSRTKSMLQIL